MGERSILHERVAWVFTHLGPYKREYPLTVSPRCQWIPIFSQNSQELFRRASRTSQKYLAVPSSDLVNRTSLFEIFSCLDRVSKAIVRRKSMTCFASGTSVCFVHHSPSFFAAGHLFSLFYKPGNLLFGSPFSSQPFFGNWRIMQD